MNTLTTQAFQSFTHDQLEVVITYYRKTKQSLKLASALTAKKLLPKRKTLLNLAKLIAVQSNKESVIINKIKQARANNKPEKRLINQLNLASRKKLNAVFELNRTHKLSTYTVQVVINRLTQKGIDTFALNNTLISLLNKG